MPKLNIAVSVLDLLPIREGSDTSAAIQRMVSLAQTVEKLGYTRYWIAEHHNTPTLISSATSILVKHALEHTSSIRVGSGGVMLPNHSPLIVAEQFGTMATMYPDRVDLGLGRAPGTDEAAAAAIRRSQGDSAHSFPDDVKSLLTYLGLAQHQGAVKAYPGIETKVPLYILGSSTDSAYLAAKLGLPYAFGAHFAPTRLGEAISVYRQHFQPSVHLSEPYVMASANVVAADSDDEALFLASTMDRVFLNIIRGGQQLMQPPIANVNTEPNAQEKEVLSSMSKVTFKGSKATITQQLTHFQSFYNVDELIVNSFIYEEDKLKRSFEILKEVVDGK
ncbi:LLM class flavin-dependent oxidoreductase [Saccharibacillus sacchari]|uniref:LLM class flavin-dependent oxidoreductase n=1 Tax=Saccharibacillus sacchari TaxID=456493 RepID=UPI0004B26002|nr:LLM class flavin-dependent oxidoreductase [Saccharibacillus sacchari]